MPAQIMVIDSQLQELQATKDILTRHGFNVIQSTGGMMALKQIEAMRGEIDMVILDVVLDELNGYEVCRSLRRHPDTVHLPILAFTAPESREQKTEVFEAGADDCMSKPYEPSELLARVKVQLRRAAFAPNRTEKAATKCKTLAVHSLRGGAGVTTLAANLATSLAQIWQQDVVMMDLVLAASQARLMFNLSPRNTWAELIRMPVEDIDDHVLDTMLLRHKSGVSVLPAPRVQNCRDPLDGARVRQLLSLLRARFHCIVLDTPHDLQQGTVTALDESDKILSVMVPELASLAGANAALEVFQTMNYPANRVHVVLNRIHERHQVDQRQIETTLKRPVDVIIPYAGYAATEAINLGEPVTLSSPESAVSTAVEDLAFCLSKKDHPEEPPADPSHAWQRATRRWGRKDHKGFRRLFGWRSPASSEPQPGN